MRLKLIKAVRSRAEKCDFRGGDLFACLCLAFMIASIVFSLGADFQDLAYARQYPLLLSAAITAVGWVSFSLGTVLLKTKKPLAWLLLGACLTLCIILVCYRPEDIFFSLGLCTAAVITAKYVCDGDKLGLSKIKVTNRASFVITAVLVLLFTAAVYIFTAAKYRAFYHSAFDFGIFCQMFESMATTGLPMTTVERSEYLSHFAVHFSPFFYLLLPGYMIFRSPLYLLFCQALGVGLGAFAVKRICRGLGLSLKCSTAMAAVYLLFPTMANGCFFDFHENKFLSVLILWAVAYAIEKKPAGTGIFLFLILTVKEDAFIYVLAICLWMIVTKRNRIFALVCAAASVLWFFFATSMIELCGGEIMTGRFSNFVSGPNGGLLEAVRTCFVDIGYLFKEVFAGADTEKFQEMTYEGQKLEFVLWTAAPLLFTPFVRKRPSELILLFPILVINLMPSWLYQYNVDYQYTYGTAALLVAAAVLFLSEHSPKSRPFVIVSMICVCIVLTASLVPAKAQRYLASYYDNKEAYDETAAALETISADSSVTAYGFIVPHLAYVKELRTCPEYYAEYKKTDYYVIDTRYEYDNHTTKMHIAMGSDYELLESAGYIRIYGLKENNE